MILHISRVDLPRPTFPIIHSSLLILLLLSLLLLLLLALLLKLLAIMRGRKLKKELKVTQQMVGMQLVMPRRYQL